MTDEQKLQQFLKKMLADFGAAMSVPLVRIGIRLGLYKTLDQAGPMTSAEFATSANISERYAREWLAQNAASGYLSYDPASRRFELPPEQALEMNRKFQEYLHRFGDLQQLLRPVLQELAQAKR